MKIIFYNPIIFYELKNNLDNFSYQNFICRKFDYT
jgi:hypothetical protein